MVVGSEERARMRHGVVVQELRQRPGYRDTIVGRCTSAYLIQQYQTARRQVIHDTPSVGQLKTHSAAQRLQALNPLVTLKSYNARADAKSLPLLLRDYDVVADGSDNFETRYAVADAALAMKRPLITAALGRFDASLTTVRGYEKNTNGNWNPTYRCLFPEPPPAGTVAPCAEAGVLGALAGVMGSLMALEVIRAITPFGDALIGRLLMVDALSMRFETISYERQIPPPV